MHPTVKHPHQVCVRPLTSPLQATVGVTTDELPGLHKLLRFLLRLHNSQLRV